MYVDLGYLNRHATILRKNMGLIQSILCSITFCTERVVAWLCCAFMLLLLMFVLVLVMVYGISLGYHYAQKELANLAMFSRMTTKPPSIRRSEEEDTRPIVRLLAVNKTEGEIAQPPVLEVYKSNEPAQQIYIETTAAAPVILLETDKSTKRPGLSEHERELAMQLIGRNKRSRNTTEVSFLRPLHPKNGTDYFQLAAT